MQSPIPIDGSSNAAIFEPLRVRHPAEVSKCYSSVSRSSRSYWHFRRSRWMQPGLRLLAVKNLLLSLLLREFQPAHRARRSRKESWRRYPPIRRSPASSTRSLPSTATVMAATTFSRRVPPRKLGSRRTWSQKSSRVRALSPRSFTLTRRCRSTIARHAHDRQSSPHAVSRAVLAAGYNPPRSCNLSVHSLSPIRRRVRLGAEVWTQDSA